MATLSVSTDKEKKNNEKSKVRAFYKLLLKTCDKYDKIKGNFDEIYNPVNEQYQELSKIPGLIPESSQTIIQNAFDNIDEVTGIADDFCSTIRGEFEPILKRLKISVEKIIDEVAIEKAQQVNSVTPDANTTNTSAAANTSANTSGGSGAATASSSVGTTGISTAAASGTTGILTTKIIAIVAVAALFVGGGSYAVIQSGIESSSSPSFGDGSVGAMNDVTNEIISSDSDVPTKDDIVGSAEIIVEPAIGSGAPGCEETADGCYIPGTATVGVGGVVIFSNTDSAAHTFTSGDPATVEDNGTLFDSSLVMEGSTYEWSPTEAGEIPYFCMVHPWMQGVIIVEEISNTTYPDEIFTIIEPIPLKLKVSDISSTNIFSQLPLTLSVKVEVNLPVENADVEFFIDANSFGLSKSDDNGIASKTISNLNYTKHQWYSIASKEGYITSEKFETTSFTLEDTNPPKLEIISPTSGQFLKESSIPMYGTLSDEKSRVTQLDVSINDQIQDVKVSPNWQTQIELVEGTNSIIVSAKDNSGQISEQEITIVLDTVPPEIQASTNNLPNSEGWFNFPVSIKWEGIDEKNASCTKSKLHKENGIFTLKGECFDQAGNKGTGEYSIKYDSVRPSIPEIAVFDLNDAEIFDTTIFASGLIFEFDSQDNLSGVNEYLCSYNNTPFSICSDEVLGRSDGEHQLEVKAVDLAENESLESIFQWSRITPR